MTAACPTCDRDVRVNGDGSLRAHEADGQRCTGADAVLVTIGLPWAAPPLTKNKVRRLHHYAEAKLRDTVVTTARYVIRNAHLTPVVGANIVLHWRVGDRRRRDGDGAAPTLAALIDAIVLERVLPDDSFIHVPFSGIHVHPPEPGQPGALWLVLTPPDGEDFAAWTPTERSRP